MILMKTHLTMANELRQRFGKETNQNWTNQADNIYVPIDGKTNITLEYENMNGTVSIKQADVVLVDDLLDYVNLEAQVNLDYYASKQSLNGPGMTYGVYSIVANEISPSGCSSYTYGLYGSLPYIRQPWFEYSEQTLDNYKANGGTHPAFPFLTGMGGAHRVAVFGYLGLRLMIDSLNVDPDLPPQIPFLDYRIFYWQGHAINATSNQTHTNLTRLPLSWSLTDANPKYVNSPIPVTRTVNSTWVGDLPPSGTLIIPNRGAHKIQTVEGNIAQCQWVASDPNQGHMSGQFPLSAVDGAISTKWQPIFANKTNWLAVEMLGESQPIHRISFDWGSLPPVEFNVTFRNMTDENGDPGKEILVARNKNVTISHPWNATTVLDIVRYEGNITDVDLDPPIWSGEIARLYIWGAQRNNYALHNNGSGATVAEFSIIGPKGKTNVTLAG